MKMLKSKKGQTIFVQILIFIMAFIFLVQLIAPLKEQIIQSRNPDNLDCTNASISVGQKSTCVVVDMSLFYFVATGIAVAGGFLGARLISRKAIE